MANKSLLISLIFLLLAVPYSLAATIHGTVYDMELNKAENAIVKVNTVPEQTIVAKDGSYSFNIPNGDYIINAVYESGSGKYASTEEIKIEADGEYVVDIILFPDISEEESLLDEDIEIPEIYPEETNETWRYILLGISLLFIAVFVYLLFNKTRSRKEESAIEESIQVENVTEDLADKVLDFIKKADGRTTQKDIRKQFPLSEAKISLVITELEDKGLVKRIKKGRGNVIILKKE